MYCSILAMIFSAKIIFFYYTVSSIFRFQVNYIKKKAWSMEKNSIRWEILLKGARGTLSPEEEIIFQKWLARDIRHKAYYEKMCRVWSSDNTTYDLHTDVSE